jgi:hypothetical protein
MSNGGKGDSPRPFSVPLKKFDANWEAIFGKKTDSDETTPKEDKPNEDSNNRS